ncbi:transmembrane and coiled-coil domains protein 2 [Drosophila obscura]|uniref:transmembrane and coiled-coil domains protein 2 n=1 Tax=Drosophila obscura TaxID=7282 RepID=UPI000BA11CE6|nr:transmembrane and coiled-coil domains protein 2 [Drosophila obscura]
MDSMPNAVPTHTNPSRDLLTLQPLRPARSSSTNLRASRSPSASRSTEQMSRERASEAAAATQTAAAAAGGASSSTGGTAAASATATTTAIAAASSSGPASGNTNSNSSASSSTVAAAQAAVYSGGNTVTGSLGSGGVVARGFRSHSPTHRRRSRERQRRTHGSDQGGLLAYSGLVGVNDMNDFGGVVGGGTQGGGGGSAGTGSGLEDSRLSGNEDYYSSFVSDEFDSSKRPRRCTHERSSSVQAIDRLNTKIQCTKESIRQEQTARDDNVNEYLKLAASADKQQLQRIKAVFEKKNQKSAHSISQLQKKLDSYTKRAKDHQYQTKSQHRQPREVLRDVGQGLRNVGGNIRDGITGFSGSVMSKPREFAHLIKNKFGSADNINQMSDAELQGMQAANAADVLAANERLQQQVPGAGTSTGSGGGGGGHNNNTGTGSGTGKFNSDNGSECSSVTSESIPAGSGKSQSGASQYHIVLKTLLTELAERKAENEKLKERMDRLETSQKEFNNLTATLESERYRAEGLEEQINDLTELHQNEIENLKQTIADMEEKVQYQSDERLRDVNEVLENCQTRISKMEHMSQQQYVTVEGIDNSNARALVVKLINVVLTILQVVLLLVATAAGIIMPFLKTRVRVLTTFLSICFVIFVIRQWPDVQDIGSGLVRHLKQSLVVK